MSIGHSQEIIGRLGPRVFQTFVLLGALALCALVFASKEAQAQELPQVQHAVVGEQDAGRLSRTPVEAAPDEEASPREARPARTSPAEPASQPAPIRPESPAEEPLATAPDPALAEPEPPLESALPDPKPASEPALLSGTGFEPVTVPARQEDGAETQNEPYLTPPVPEPAASESASEPAPESVPVTSAGLEMPPGPTDTGRSPLEPEPAANEESGPLPLLDREAPAEEPAAVYSGEEDGPYPLYVLGTSSVDEVETLREALEDAAAGALGALVEEDLPGPAAEEGEGSIDTMLAGLFYGQEAGHGSASEAGGEQKPYPARTGPESPLQDDAPQPVSPFTPPAGNSFSPSGGQANTGMIALLLCVLASGLILIRREFELSWAFCRLPKPSSALLLPPERPG